MLRHLFKTVVTLNVLIALAAGAATHLTLIRLQTAPCSMIPLMVFAGTLAIYNFPRFPWKRFNLRTGVFILSGSAALFLATSLNDHAKVALLLSVILSLAYIMPVRLKQQNLKGIRNIFILKNLTLALTWAMVTVWIPVVACGAITVFWKEIFWMRFLFVFSITVLFDIRDLDADRTRKHLTLPVAIGTHASKLLAGLSTILFSITALLLSHKGHIAMPMMVAFQLSALLLALAIYKAPSGKNFSFYQVCLDSLLTVQWLLVVIAQQVNF